MLKKTARRNFPILLVICLIAAGIRLWGIDFGLPYLYHPDEPNKIEAAQRVLKSRDINPHYFLKPPFYIYLNTAAYLPYLAYQRISGDPSPIWSLEAPNMLAMGTGYTSQPITVLLGRLLTLLFGSLCAVLVYFLALKVFDNRVPATRATAALAALLVALSPGLTPHSRYITPDTMVVFFCLLSAYVSFNIYDKARPIDYILAGVCGALAASVKYNAVIVLLLPPVAHLLRSGSLGAAIRDRKIWLSVIAAPLTFILLNPVFVLNFQEFYQGASFEASHYSTGHLGMEGITLPWYLTYFWKTEGLVALLGVAGILLALYRRNKRVLLLAAFPVVFFIFISSFAVRNDRTAIPITPFLYLIAANLLVMFFQRGKTLPRACAAVVGAFLLIYAAASTIHTTILFTQPDSRETSRAWIEQTLPAGKKIAIESYAPYVDPRRYQVNAYWEIIDKDPAYYRANGFDYLVVSQGMFGRFFANPALYTPQIEKYNQLFAAFPLLKQFTDGDYEVRVYEVR